LSFFSLLKAIGDQSIHSAFTHKGELSHCYVVHGSNRCFVSGDTIVACVVIEYVTFCVSRTCIEKACREKKLRESQLSLALKTEAQPG